jgi:hypothetical protein
MSGFECLEDMIINDDGVSACDAGYVCFLCITSANLTDFKRKWLIAMALSRVEAVRSPCQEPALARKPSVGQGGKNLPGLATGLASSRLGQCSPGTSRSAWHKESV